MEPQKIEISVSLWTWLVVIQLLLIHWKLAYAIPLSWPLTFIVAIGVAGAVLALIIVNTIRYIRGLSSRKGV